MHTISSIIAISKRSGYFVLYTLPKVQNTTSATLELSAKYSTIATTPPKNIAIAIPASMMLVALKLRSFDIKNMISVGIIAKIKAKSTIQIEPLRILPPQIIAIQAPHAAPCETPIVDGAAKGFPNEL